MGVFAFENVEVTAEGFPFWGKTEQFFQLRL